jgi:Putative Flp pilus-assembly TadE/G-like
VLVAVVMLFVVGAMAALSIDVVTLYTARSEAQLAADGAALAGARVLANSGMTSDTTGGLTATAEAQAIAVATQVATQNEVGGRKLVAAEVVAVNFAGPTTNPRVTVRVQRTDLPTFFARIWGSKQITVAASATAEAYNPSGANALGLVTTPVAPICVKPWLLPNIDPSSGGTIFDTTTGAITNTGLLGWASTTTATRLQPACINCSPPPPLPVPAAWRYYPGDTATTFPPPSQALPTCNPVLTTAYQESVAGCIQTPISCNSTAIFDTSDYTNRRTETAHAVNCLTHAKADQGDTVDAPFPPATPFEFIAGADNPVAVVDPTFVGKEMMISDSLVTVPVFNSNGAAPTNPVTIVGFVQLFLNPDGIHTPNSGGNSGYVNTTVVNMAGCGTGATGQPILGNGASPVAVRLISPP